MFKQIKAFKKIKIKIKSQKEKELAGVGRWGWPPIFIAAVLGLHWCNFKSIHTAALLLPVIPQDCKSITTAMI